jgi:hypothetical protein
MMILAPDSGTWRNPMDSRTKDYQDKAKGLLRAEIKRRNLNYDQLAEKLAAIGVKESSRNLSNKISRGGFTAGFFIQCLDAIGCQSLRLSD